MSGRFSAFCDGLRISRSDDTTTYKYQYLDGQLVMMEVGEVRLYFNYDASGTPLSIVYNRPNGEDERTSTTYYYVTNLQGDVVGIVNQSGNQIVGYTYDAWGNILTQTSSGTVGEILKTLNPLRYRGYVYDCETKLYYLQSRYYNPEIGRFINADTLVATGQGFCGNNMFAYCLDNPIMYVDYTGKCSHSAHAPWLGDCARCNVKYDVPLYNQRDTKLCWAVSQAMVHDFQTNTVRSQEDALQMSKVLASFLYGEDSWNQGGYPTNCAGYGPNGTPLIETNINSISDLAGYLCDNGPIYAVYKTQNPSTAGAHSYHMIVVTGADVVNNKVFTNNPWGYSGSQSYNEFLNGLLGMGTKSYTLMYYIPIESGG